MIVKQGLLQGLLYIIMLATTNSVNLRVTKRQKLPPNKELSEMTTSAVLDIRGGGDPNNGLSNTMTFLNWLDLGGTAVFALSGTIAAGKNNMDILGCLVIACVTAMGGGTTRDVLLGRTPVFWCKNPIFLKICIYTCLVTFFAWPTVESFGGRDDGMLLCVADALGMAAFSVLGAAAALQDGFSPLICCTCGLFSACFGGVARDVLCQRPVRILHAYKSIYGTPPLLGAATFIYLGDKFPGHEDMSALSGFLVTFATRAVAFTWKFKGPSWLLEPQHSNEIDQRDSKKSSIKSESVTERDDTMIE